MGKVGSVLLTVAALGFAAPAFAQDTTQTYSAEGSGNVNAGAAVNTPSGGTMNTSDIRLVGQGRFDALNLVDSLGGGAPAHFTPIVPFITLGVRLLDTRLFIGAGLGLAGGSQDGAGGSSTGRFSIAFTPLASFDFLYNEYAALYAVAMFNLVSVGESTTENGAASTDNNDGGFGLGINAGIGIRGKLTEALAIGTEFGWGFTSVSPDNNADSFDHGFWGALNFEASIGL